MKSHILVVDDEPDIRRLVKEILEDEGYVVQVAKDGSSAKQVLKEHAPDLILLDIWMPDIDGISLLKEMLGEYHLTCPVIMMSGHGTVEAAVEATRLGAVDFVEKPLSLSKLLMTVEQAFAKPESANNQRKPNAQLEKVEIVGKSEQMHQLQGHLERAASHKVNVLLLGETGSGRAKFARYIHQKGQQHDAPYIEFRTAVLSGSQGARDVDILLGKEHPLKRGIFEQVNNGTLYIDDIAELSEQAQGALFSVLNSGQCYRVNGEEGLQLGFRVIATTQHDLPARVKAKRFREDLYHLLNVFPIRVPSLREYAEDVPELLNYYVRLYTDKDGLPYRSFTMAAQNRLRNYQWPGNVLELENVVRRLLISNGDVNIDIPEVDEILASPEYAAQLGSSMSAGMPEFELPLRQAREQFEKAYLEFHLRNSEGSVGKVAKIAGMERTHLYRKLRSLGIDTK